MLNHIVVAGRLTRDPELRYTQSQTPVATFAVACDRDFESGEGGKMTDFLEVVAWRKTAEFVDKYFQKGALVIVSGRLQIRDWKDRDGAVRRSAEIVADHVYFGESKRSQEQPQPASGSFAPASRPVDVPSPFTDLVDDDGGELPF